MRLFNTTDPRHFGASLFVIILSAGAVEAMDFNVDTKNGFQDALDAAAANGEADTINIAAGTIDVLQGVHGTNDGLHYVAEAGENFPLTIQGAGVGESMIDSQLARRLLLVDTRGAGDDSNAAVTVRGISFLAGIVGQAPDPDGGGLYIETGTAPITIQNCEFNDNVANDDGGGLSASIENGAGSFILVEDNSFYNNRAAGTPFYGQDGTGGGTKLDGNGADITLRNNSFDMNEGAHGGGGAEISDAGSALIVGNTFADNFIGNFGDGGGLNVDIEGPVDVRNNIFLRNAAFDGGGARLEQFTDAEVVNNVFIKNVARGQDPGFDSNGGGLEIESSPGFANSIKMTNNTIYENTGANGGGVNIDLRTGQVADIFNNIIWDNFSTLDDQAADVYADDDEDEDDVGATINLDYNDIGGFWSECEQEIPGCALNTDIGVNNVDVDPLLVDWNNGDAHLKPESPVIDIGNNTAPAIPNADFENDARIQFGKGFTNAVVDLGADEIGTVTPAAASGTNTIAVLNSGGGPGGIGRFKTLSQQSGSNVALLRTLASGAIDVELRKMSSGDLVNNINFLGASFEALMMTSLADSNGNGADEIAVLAKNRTTGALVAQIRDSATDDRIANATFLGAVYVAIDLKALPDQNGDGAQDLALLAIDSRDGRFVVQIRDGKTGEKLKNIFLLGPAYAPIDLVVIPDSDGSGSDEIGVLSSHKQLGSFLVQVKNLSGAAGTRNVFYLGPAYEPLGATVTPDMDNDGIPEIAVLARHTGSGKFAVQARAAFGKKTPLTSFYLDGSYRALGLATVNDSDNDSFPEVAVLAYRPANRRFLAQVRNLTVPRRARNVFFMDATWEPIGLITVDDVDGNAVPEVGALGKRTSDGRKRLHIRNAAGTPPGGVNVFFSPE